MKGRAPKSPETGSQLLAVQNPSPNFEMARREEYARTRKIPPTATRTRDATRPVPRRNPWSDCDRLGDGFSWLIGSIGPCLLGLDLLHRVLLELHDARGKGSIAE